MSREKSRGGAEVEGRAEGRGSRSGDRVESWRVELHGDWLRDAGGDTGVLVDGGVTWLGCVGYSLILAGPRIPDWGSVTDRPIGYQVLVGTVFIYSLIRFLSHFCYSVIYFSLYYCHGRHCAARGRSAITRLSSRRASLHHVHVLSYRPYGPARQRDESVRVITRTVSVCGCIGLWCIGLWFGLWVECIVVLCRYYVSLSMLYAMAWRRSPRSPCSPRPPPGPPFRRSPRPASRPRRGSTAS